MSRADRVAHLSGYAGIVAVLASANWSGMIGSFVGFLFVVGVVGYAGVIGYDVVSKRLRAEAKAAAEETPTPAADGGRRDLGDEQGEA